MPKMTFLPQEIRTRITPKGEHILAFSMTREEYEMFLEYFKKDKKYRIEIGEHFGGKTFNQRGYFHAHVRALAERFHWGFDYTKHFVLTEDGIEILEQNNGQMVSKTIEFSKDIVGENIDNFIHKFARREHIYLRHESTTDTGYVFRMFKGISFLDSREMSVVIDRLIDRCNDAGVPTISCDEYKRKMGE